ncbi:MAG: hypothetical protein ACYCZX_09530 [Rhodospirillaceae bacterium]
MLAVTNFEVYVLERGRWTLHARYAGDDRREAMWDAQSTEAHTGFPAKIVRETFFPELNDSERITTYISPNAKKATKGRPVGTVPRAREPKPRPRAPSNLRQLNAGQIMLRVLVAGAFSVIAAAVMAFVIKWVLQSFADIGLTVSAAATSMIMTYSWVAMFLLFFFSLFRSRLQLHRVLADMWQASARPAAAAVARVKPVNLKLKPKYDRATSPETLKEWQDLRMRRGDPDIFTSPDDLAPELPVLNGASGAGAPGAEGIKPAAERKTAEGPQEKQFQDKAAEKAAQDKAAREKAEKDKPLSAKEQAAKDQALKDQALKDQEAKDRAAKAKAAAEKATQEKAAAEKKAAEQAEMNFVAPPPTLDAEDDFAHTALRRFIAEVVKPAAAAAMRDDPVTRRGMALAIAGAIDAVAARPEARGLNSRALLMWGLAIAGIVPGVAALFVASQDEYVGQAANQSLVATGQGLMADMIPLQSPNVAVFVDTLASALAAWRTPFGQPGMLLAEPESHFDAAMVDAAAPAALDMNFGNDFAPPRRGLLDVFLLTELRPLSRHDDAVADDARMAAHNDRVRQALSTGGGQEVKHTGKGIFARFGDPGMALAAVKELQRDLGQGIALAVIGNSSAAEDPTLSSALFLRAEAAMNVTGDGQASVEAHVIGEEQRLGQPTDLVILVAPSAAPAPRSPIVDAAAPVS